MYKLTSTLQKYPQLDPPKRRHGLHVVIGFLRTQFPFSSEEEREHFSDCLSQIVNIHIGQTMVRYVWLVHYANRTLNRIVGKVSFTLGSPNSLTAKQLLENLGISVQVDTYS